MEVHTVIGPGLAESIYQRALVAELRDRKVACEIEVVIPVYYKSELVRHHRIDLVVDHRLIVEAKAVARLAPIHVAQLLSYLRLARLRIGLLVNFEVDHLRYGIRRVIL
jgi:GxxExxY protein